jgi:hypothetical protein
MRNPFEGIIKDGEMPHQSMIAVKIEWGSHFFSNLLNGNPLTLKLMILILKKMHPIPQY